MTANEGGYCVDCPDHEACSTGWPCWKVKELAELRSARAAIGPDSERVRELEAEVERLRNRSVGEKFDDLMNNLPSEYVDCEGLLEDD